MNQTKSTPVVNTVVLDLSENLTIADETQSEDQNTAVELAKILGSKLCRKTGLPQIFLSLNIGIEQVAELKGNFKLLAGLEAKISDLIKELF